MARKRIERHLHRESVRQDERSITGTMRIGQQGVAIGSAPFLVTITGWIAHPNGNAQWLYDWTEYERLSDGTMAVKSGGRTSADEGRAYNTIEENNGIQRTGWKAPGTDQSGSLYQSSTFTLQPIGGNNGGSIAIEVPVMLFPTRFACGITMYEFSLSNDHKGECG